MKTPIKRCPLLTSTLSGTRILMEVSPTGAIRHETLLQRYLGFMPSGDTPLNNPDRNKMPRCMLSLTRTTLEAGFNISSFAWDDESMALFYALNVPNGTNVRSGTYIGGAYYSDTEQFMRPTDPSITYFGPERATGVQVEPAPFKTGHALGQFPLKGFEQPQDLFAWRAAEDRSD